MSNMFFNEITKPLDRKLLLDSMERKQKADGVHELVMNRQFCSDTSKISPFIKIVLIVLTYFSYYSCHLSTVT